VARAQAAALGTGGEGLEESYIHALSLFRFAIGVVRPLLDERQLAVAHHALAVAERYGKEWVT